MSMLAPPPAPPFVAVDDNDGLRRVHQRLRQLLIATLTIFITAWCCTYGAIPAILSIMVAKHILVAVLVMGLGVDATRTVTKD